MFSDNPIKPKSKAVLSAAENNCHNEGVALFGGFGKAEIVNRGEYYERKLEHERSSKEFYKKVYDSVLAVGYDGWTKFRIFESCKNDAWALTHI